MKKENLEIIFKIITIIELAICGLLAIKLNSLYKMKDNLNERVKELEIDYKIYEMNLSELQENREVQFE